MYRILGAILSVTLISSAFADTAECLHGELRVKDIVGLYRKSVNGLPAQIGHPEEKLSGYNYLAISAIENDRLRVRLSTKEINGHDCSIDSEAKLCGHTVQLIPNQDELSILDSRNLPSPVILVTKSKIAFAPYANGAYVWGSPYCGTMGYLRHSFYRSTKTENINNSVFEQ